MTIKEAIAIVNADTDSGLIGRAARANWREAYVLITAYNRYRRDENSFTALCLIEAAMNWQAMIEMEGAL